MPAGFVERCLSIDLEVGPRDHRIHRFAAVRGDTGAAFVHRGGNLGLALARVAAFAEGCDFLLGHNLLAFDAIHLAAAAPGSSLLAKPMIDTLRLNPLAFPRNPYHALVKHYHDGQLRRGRINDPELDARLTLQVLREQIDALRRAVDADQDAPDRVAAWHALLGPGSAAVDAFFESIRGRPAPDDAGLSAALRRCLAGKACRTQQRLAIASATATPADAWPLAYALAWLSVAGGNSVMPPWVRHQFPAAVRLIRQLRDVRCDDPACAWCREHHDAQRELERWFGLHAFRPEPRDAEGRPLQRAIVEAALRGEHVLGILPTGAGKSLCYQLPALSRYHKLGALTVVVSPLVALMADQIAGLQARGIGAAVALNGLLSMPERADVLDRVRLGDAGILIVSPEQLRSRALRRVLAQREIGGWVLDEAHCLSKWGHDFRPDYRYVARVIGEYARDEPLPPLLCLTATAKPDVVAEIVAHFRDRLRAELTIFNGGAARENLVFEVLPTSAAVKLHHVEQLLAAELPPEVAGGAIVYCSSRARTEQASQFLRAKGWAAGHFHAGLSPEVRKDVQRRFIDGELRVIAATNAFGMGIDKPDVRIVVHADVPGSLENYLQEAGRAGRDRDAARCVLLYASDDVERQFGVSARSRLTQNEIEAILRALRRIDVRKRMHGEVVATPGEILLEDEDGAFQRDTLTDDTRVRTAIAWLEEATLLAREENLVQVFPSSLRVASLDEARQRLASRGVMLAPAYRNALLAIVEALLGADPDEGISTDDLMQAARLGPEAVRSALFDLEQLGLASNDTALTAYVHAGIERSSRMRLQQASALEAALIEQLREAAPELQKGEASLLHMRHATQRLKDAGHPQAVPELLWRLLRSLAADGRSVDDAEGGGASLGLRRIDAETIELRLHRTWSALARTSELRRAAAQRLLDHLLDRLPEGARGADLLARTTLGALHAAIVGDAVLASHVRDPRRLLDHALLWLHEQEAIRLHKGLAVFRPAMTIRLASGRRRFAKKDFEPLRLHYRELVLQIHVMAEYAERGLRAMADALRLAMDYFSLRRDDFVQRWMPGRAPDLARETTPQSWQSIVESVRDEAQKRIVADDRDGVNVLVLAGPGAGKTRVLVHRIAYLVRVRRENARGILALAYNRHAAVQIRKRLRELIGDDANGVTVLTCHALAMRLAGVSFERRSAPADEAVFDAALREAVALLEGKGLPQDEADAQRERLLAGFRWILVDEYQDVGPGQYALIAALAGRTLKDDEAKLGLFAVGDDDQNIYAFSGASVAFIRRFQSDYDAAIETLTRNYRSTAHIIAAANRIIEPAAQRLKAGRPIEIDAQRAREPAGGEWSAIDPVARGRVQVLAGGASAQAQALVAVDELRRLAAFDAGWDWARCAVIAREWRFLEPVRSYCELLGVPAQWADESGVPFRRLRETQMLLRSLRDRESDAALAEPDAMASWIEARRIERPNPWWSLLAEAVEQYALETQGAPALPVAHFTDWLVDWSRDARRRQTGLLLTSAHRAKGLEFDHVVVLDGGWDAVSAGEDRDAPRRLYYVAVTRARRTLALTRLAPPSPRLAEGLAGMPCVLERSVPPMREIPRELSRRYRRAELDQLYLSFAGRHPAGSALHRRIGALQVGDTLELDGRPGQWVVRDAQRFVVGRMARAFDVPSDTRCIDARVAAIIVRRRADSEPAFAAQLRSDEWEVVVPEFVFEAG